jgi:hypothetical protein
LLNIGCNGFILSAREKRIDACCTEAARPKRNGVQVQDFSKERMNLELGNSGKEKSGFLSS